MPFDVASVIQVYSSFLAWGCPEYPACTLLVDDQGLCGEAIN
jgi:hypothetical protein